MAKVKELIKDSEFITSEGFDSLQPKVTVVIPTFRRGDNGLFKQAVESILNQSFRDFELIIVDDASVDSTFSQIRHFMEIDNRVAVIRHKKNIGLPAVSEAEAFFKARSDRFFYAFDDDIFHKDAIKDLYDYFGRNQNIHVVHGIVKVGPWTLGHKSYTFEDMHQMNYLPNPCLMIERRVLEDVGLYDPHVSLVSGCDWDLWIRILSKKYKIGVVRKELCFEQGVLQDDSLGNMYKTIDLFPVYEIIDEDRNEILLPNNIPEREVDSLDGWSSYSQDAICNLLNTKFHNKFWYKKKSSKQVSVTYSIVVTNKYCKNRSDTSKTIYIYTRNLTKRLEKALKKCQTFFYVTLKDFYCVYYFYRVSNNPFISENILIGKMLKNINEKDITNLKILKALEQLDPKQLEIIMKQSPFKIIRRFIKHCLKIEKYKIYTLNMFLLYFKYRFLILFSCLKGLITK